MKTIIEIKKAWLILIPCILVSSFIVASCNTMFVFQPSTPTPTSPPTFTASPTITAPPTHTTPTRTPTPTLTPEPTRSIPSGTPVSLFHNIPIPSDAVAAEGQPKDRWYVYVTEVDQDIVLEYYLQRLPAIGWEIDWVSENDKGGYIIYRKNVLDFIYIYEDQERSLTFVDIFLSTGSPSLNP
ncbi:MAG: hypothetical protein DPW18_06115 [Chloroflexi bacterium]|nr:hypothetical protein [Chloroflexota bacterium]MDL1941849.1 hypothetical protein [Chloroflexi bacterium CFX2]